MWKNPAFSPRVKIHQFHELKQRFHRGVSLIKPLMPGGNKKVKYT